MKRRLLLGALVLIVLAATGWTLVRPSNDRHWSSSQELLPMPEFRGDSVIIHGLRNFAYAADGTPRRRYEDRAYDLGKLTTAWFVLAPFSRENRGPAHTFLSFGFADSQYVAISVEARRQNRRARSAQARDHAQSESIPPD